jgi:hypothetical protein
MTDHSVKPGLDIIKFINLCKKDKVNQYVHSYLFLIVPKQSACQWESSRSKLVKELNPNPFLLKRKYLQFIYIGQILKDYLLSEGWIA